VTKHLPIASKSHWLIIWVRIMSEILSLIPQSLDAKPGLYPLNKTDTTNSYALRPATFPLMSAIADSRVNPLPVLLGKLLGVWNSAKVP
jgi:hypothetical protein